MLVPQSLTKKTIFYNSSSELSNNSSRSTKIIEIEKNYIYSLSVIPIPVSTYTCNWQLNSHILLGLLKSMLGCVGTLTKVFISCLFL